MSKRLLSVCPRAAVGRSVARNASPPEQKARAPEANLRRRRIAPSPKKGHPEVLPESTQTTRIEASISLPWFSVAEACFSAYNCQAARWRVGEESLETGPAVHKGGRTKFGQKWPHQLRIRNTVGSKSTIFHAGAGFEVHIWQVRAEPDLLRS